jgi:hypothetical protein
MTVWVLIMYATISGIGQIVIPGISTQAECERLAQEIGKDVSWMPSHKCLPYLTASR